MPLTGIVRKIDELGRIVLPIEIRKALDIKDRDQIEIHVEGSTIVLTKYIPPQAESDKTYICVNCGKEMSLKELQNHIA